MKAQNHTLWPPEVCHALRQGAEIMVLSGAGMAAESGIPTFRDALDGHWSRFRPEELATPEAFAAHPERVWRWYSHRRGQIRKAMPHEGHAALVALERQSSRFTIVTQNVDGLHQRAGSRRVIELHGNILRTVCSITGREINDHWLADHPGNPPRSPHHESGQGRPDVVWFGESLPEQALHEAIYLAERADICLCIGTSSIVQPAASLPLMARNAGALVVEINPEPTPLSQRAHHCIRARAGDALPRLLSAL